MQLTNQLAIVVFCSILSNKLFVKDVLNFSGNIQRVEPSAFVTPPPWSATVHILWAALLVSIGL